MAPPAAFCAGMCITNCGLGAKDAAERLAFDIVFRTVVVLGCTNVRGGLADKHRGRKADDWEDNATGRVLAVRKILTKITGKKTEIEDIPSLRTLGERERPRILSVFGQSTTVKQPIIQ